MTLTSTLRFYTPPTTAGEFNFVDINKVRETAGRNGFGYGSPCGSDCACGCDCDCDRGCARCRQVTDNSKENVTKSYWVNTKGEACKTAGKAADCAVRPPGAAVPVYR